MSCFVKKGFCFVVLGLPIQLICPSIDGLKYRAYLTDFEIVQGELKMQLRLRYRRKGKSSSILWPIGANQGKSGQLGRMEPIGVECGPMWQNETEWG